MPVAPMLRMASRKGIPSLIQEQNSFPGLTNRLLSKTVDSICVAFDGMEKYFPANKLTVTGNPVRKEIIEMNGNRPEAMLHFGLRDSMKVVLVVGGSQGAPLHKPFHWPSPGGYTYSRHTTDMAVRARISANGQGDRLLPAPVATIASTCA